MARPSRATGPVPLRTARGAGREDRLERLERADALRPLPFALLRAGAFPRALEPDFVPDLSDFDGSEERDEGGADVRVAMLTNLRDRHTSHTLHTRGEPGDLGGRLTPPRVTSRLSPCPTWGLLAPPSLLR